MNIFASISSNYPFFFKSKLTEQKGSSTRAELIWQNGSLYFGFGRVTLATKLCSSWRFGCGGVGGDMSNLFLKSPSKLSSSRLGLPASILDINDEDDEAEEALKEAAEELENEDEDEDEDLDDDEDENEDELLDEADVLDPVEDSLFSDVSAWTLDSTLEETKFGAWAKLQDFTKATEKLELPFKNQFIYFQQLSSQRQPLNP